MTRTPSRVARWAVTLALLVGCSREAQRPDTPAPAPAAVAPAASTTSFRCGEHPVSVDSVGDAVRLTVGAEAFALRPLEAASGARYEAVEDPTTHFWDKSGSATLVLRGADPVSCTRVDPAEQPRVARGNEPGWKLELRGDVLTLVTQEGQGRLEARATLTEATAQQRSYAASTGSGELRVTFRDSRCIDTMSGMPHPYTVGVRLGGKSLSGCGGEPALLLQGAEWVVSKLSGVLAIAEPPATLRFGADGRVSGSSSCNRYSGGYTLTGEGLTFSQMASTRRACAPELMKQEAALFEALGQVQRFDLSPEDALRLFAGDTPVLEARRAQR
jgi:heat shock protein HslJ/membrane-bound inhibitor of C-type lysozyme